MFQAGVKNLFHAKHLSTEDLFAIVDPPINLIESDIDIPREVVQALVINEIADQHGERRNSGCRKRRH